MSKRKLARIAALASTALVGAALIGSVVATTGAYFTDSHGGQIAGTNGTVAISVTGSGSTSVNDPGLVQFDFSGILPGAPGKTATINVTNPTANSEDVYLVFSNTNGMWSAVNNLGQFGEFWVGGYVYDNLANRSLPPTPGVLGTPSGGNMTYPGCETVLRVPQNYLPHAIKIATLAGGGGNISVPVTFQYNACMTNHQGETLFNAAENDIGGTANAHITPGPLMFNVVAFQGGVDPTSPFNGSAAITQLDLTAFGTSNFQYIQK